MTLKKYDLDILIVRMVGDVGCERIHTEKKVQRSKVFIFTFPREGKG